MLGVDLHPLKPSAREEVQSQDLDEDLGPWLGKQKSVAPADQFTALGHLGSNKALLSLSDSFYCINAD